MNYWVRLPAIVVLVLVALLFSRAGYTIASFTATKSYDNQISTAASFPAPVSVVVLSMSPYDGATGVSTNTAVALNFSVGMDHSSTEAAFTLVPCSPNVQACAGSGAAVAGSFSWTADSKALTFTPAGSLLNTQWYRAAITTTATSANGDPLISGASIIFQTAAAPDTTAPVIVPPLIPASAATGVPGNSKITLTFSEAMQQPTVTGAFSLRPCTDASCVAAGPEVAGNFAWSGANANILTFTPAVTLTNSTTFIVQVANAAADLANHPLSNTGTPLSGGACAANAFCYKFTTAAAPGCTPAVPTAPTVTAPPSTVWTNESSYSIVGSTAPNSLVQILTDHGVRGAIDVTDTVRASQQLQGGNASFVIAVPLVTGITNTFQAVTVDSCGTRSTPTIVPDIVQGEVRTNAGTILVAPGNDTIAVNAPFTADANGNGWASVRYRAYPGGTFASPLSMTRGMNVYYATITGVAQGTQYEVEVTYADPDGVSGTAVQSVITSTRSTDGGSSTIGEQSPPDKFASRAQTRGIALLNLDSKIKRIEVVVNTTPPVSLGCQTVSGGAVAVSWDGKDGSGNYVPDGTYRYDITGYTGANCGNNAQALGSNYITVSNTGSVFVSAAAAAVTLHPGQSTAVYATAYNRHGELLPDGALVTWSARSSGGTVFSGTPTPLSRTTSTTGTSYAGECTVASGSGQACFRFTLPSNWTTIETVTITATVASQTPTGNTAVTVGGSTTINAVYP